MLRDFFFVSEILRGVFFHSLNRFFQSCRFSEPPLRAGWCTQELGPLLHDFVKPEIRHFCTFMVKQRLQPSGWSWPALVPLFSEM